MARLWHGDVSSHALQRTMERAQLSPEQASLISKQISRLGSLQR